MDTPTIDEPIDQTEPEKPSKARKAKGDGTYYDKAKGCWRYRTLITLPRSGETKRISGTPSVNTRKAAQAAMHAHTRREIDQDAHPELHAEKTRERWTLATLQERIEEYVSARHRGSTVKHYTAAFKAIAKVWGSNHQLDKITAASLLNLETKLLDSYAKGTAQLYLAKLRAAMKLAVTWDALRTVPKFPSTKVKIKRDIRFLTDSEVDRILAVCGQVTDSPMFCPMIRFALVTGLRFGELLGLQWRDIVDSKLHVSRQVTEFGIGPTKSGNPRTIPLTATATAILSSLPRASEWIFARPDGRHLNEDTAGDWMADAMSKAKITFDGSGSDPRWHALRHTFAVRLTRQGCPLVILRDLLGHSDIRTTEIYARYAPSDAGAWMARVFDGTGSPEIAAPVETAPVEPQPAIPAAEVTTPVRKKRQAKAATKPRKHSAQVNRDTPVEQPQKPESPVVLKTITYKPRKVRSRKLRPDPLPETERKPLPDMHAQDEIVPDDGYGLHLDESDLSGLDDLPDFYGHKYGHPGDMRMFLGKPDALPDVPSEPTPLFPVRKPAKPSDS